MNTPAPKFDPIKERFLDTMDELVDRIRAPHSSPTSPPQKTNGHKTTVAAEKLCAVPLMDQVLADFPFDIDQSIEAVRSNFYQCINDSTNGLSAMERDLVRLNAENPKPYIYMGELRDYKLTREIYENNKRPQAPNQPKPRFQFCYYLIPAIKELDLFFSEMEKKKPGPETIKSYEIKFMGLFKSLISDSCLSVDPKTKEEYLEYLNRRIKELKESNATQDEASFAISKLAIENFCCEYVLPKELFRYGIILGANMLFKTPKLDRIRSLNMIMPSFKEKTLAELAGYKTAEEFGIPVNFYTQANGIVFQNPISTDFRRGMVLCNFAEHLRSATVAQQTSSLWKRRFDHAFSTNPGFKFAQDPRYLDQILLLGFYGSNGDYSSVGKKMLSEEIQRKTALVLLNIYLESLYRKTLEGENNELGDEEASYWGGINQGKKESIEKLLKNKSNSIIKHYYDEIEKIFGTKEPDATQLDAANFKNNLGQFMLVESMLRTLAKSTNPLYALLGCLENIIIPKGLEYTEAGDSSTIKQTNYQSIHTVILTRLLTEKLLGDDLCKEVNWDELLKINFSSFDINTYNYYLQNPNDPKRDPYGLMKLRSAWYRFFDDKIGGPNYENKIAELVKSQEIQNAARSLVKREFTSYEERNMREHIAYYNKYLGYGSPDRINDMAA